MTRANGERESFTGGVVPISPWDKPVTKLSKRAKQWERLTHEQRLWIYTQHCRGITDDAIVSWFQTEFGFKIGKPVVTVIVNEESLPQFTKTEPYRCSGCHRNVISSPCIICTANQIKAATGT